VNPNSSTKRSRPRMALVAAAWTVFGGCLVALPWLA
jgi:hypothetical protein